MKNPQCLRQRGIIAIPASQQLSARFANAIVIGGLFVAVRLIKIANREIGLARPPFHQFARIVDRSVVDDHPFEIPKLLRDDTGI